VVSVSEESELEAIWLEYRPETLARIEAIREAARRSVADPSRRPVARREAHTLAGSAAIFGMSEGARIAREMEALLEGPGPLSAEDLARIETLADQLSVTLSR
jgi:HPt (histidine-containing phosphotransfer) domain-containing protein